MGNRQLTKLTAGQLEIMELFWERGELGVAEVWNVLQARRGVARNTVQTTLSRLAEKGWLKARAEGNAFYYQAARAKKSVISDIVGNVLKTAFAGSTSGMVMALLEGRKISPREAKQIREMIDKAETENS